MAYTSVQFAVGDDLHSRTHSIYTFDMFSVLALRVVLASAVQLPRGYFPIPHACVDNVGDNVGDMAGM